MRRAVLLLVLAFGCATKPPPDPKPPSWATCATACAHLDELGCSAAKPTPAGDTCEAVCANIEDSGVITYGVECVTRAESCGAADKCGGPTK